MRRVSFWKPVPFLRILLPFAAGILLQFYFPLPVIPVLLSAVFGLLALFTANRLSLAKRYTMRWLPGASVTVISLALGMLVLHTRNIENRADWIGHRYHPGDLVLVTVTEPLVEKPRSYKAVAKVKSVAGPYHDYKASGNLLLYFQKDTVTPAIGAGSVLLLKKALQPISNSGNPGGFDYKRYCAFRDIHYQVFLQPGDYRVLPNRAHSWFRQLLSDTRQWVLNTLRTHIDGPEERAVAEALLIGYREELDKELVQAYSNTGVVHIIAISGLHLGMIYGMMLWLLHPFKRRRWYLAVKLVSVIVVLWMFTFIAGAVPSILRSAVMFSCIVLGESIGRRTSIYNTLAASAFILLLIDPFHLWDVGFQLSYTAVTGIIAFAKPVSNWFYFRNKLLDRTWRLSAISIAAQVLTLPLVLYYFHQFPNLFLFTNLLVVPLSGLALFAGIALLMLGKIPLLNQAAGELVEWLVWLMNRLIKRTDQLPFAVTDGIQLSAFQSVLVFIALTAAAAWLMLRQRELLWVSASALLGFVALRSVDLVQVKQQRKLIVYNIPRHTAIDIVEGDRYQFYGSKELLQNASLTQFHLRPARILNRVRTGALASLQFSGHQVSSQQKQVLIIDGTSNHWQLAKPRADIIILCDNPAVRIEALAKRFNCGMFVFAASNPPWKIRLWKKDCDSLHLRHHSVPEQGAFETDL